MNESVNIAAAIITALATIIGNIAKMFSNYPLPALIITCVMIGLFPKARGFLWLAILLAIGGYGIPAFLEYNTP